MRGRTINIFIPDSNPRGVKVCDIQDSIVKAIYSPRNKLDLALARPELSEPGIYFLIGKDDEISKQEVYIGEAENLSVRIKQHNSSKDFWNIVICFVSEKKNINKAHIKFIESFACSEAKEIAKCNLENSAFPSRPSLTEQERDFALNFFDDMKILIATLGFPIFEKNLKTLENKFICKSRDITAEGEYSEDGMIVFKGSEARIEEAGGLQKWAKDLRCSLLSEGILKESNSKFVFTEDYVFNSPSASAATVLARSANGWTEWKDLNSQTLDERFRK